MILTPEAAKFIDSLREAAKEYGCVHDLLCAINKAIAFDSSGNVAIDNDMGVIHAAWIASVFSILDRPDDEDDY